MPVRYWQGGVTTNFAVPLGLGNAVLTGSPEPAGASSMVGDTLLRSRVQGHFMVRALGNGSTHLPPEGWWQGLEAWVGLWCDSGDPANTPPTDPFDNPDPVPGWLWTQFLSPVYYPSSHTAGAQSAMLYTDRAQSWSQAQRKGKTGVGMGPISTFLCWLIDAQTAPFIGTSSGGVDFEVGMDFDIRVLYEHP